jgi:hypothetical protein
MYVETQTKKLAQTVLLFSLLSLCTVFFYMAATVRHNVALPRPANFPVYTYQNPFTLAGNHSNAALSGMQPGGILSKLVSARFLLSLSGLAVLWFASACYLNRGCTKKKRVQEKAKYTDMIFADSGPKMNPLTNIPKPVTCAIKQDSPHSVVVICAPKKRCSFAHRKTTAPCQSRFRPLTLGSSQTRPGRFKLK